MGRRMALVGRGGSQPFSTVGQGLVRWQAVRRSLSLHCNAKWVPRKPVNPSSSLRGNPNRVWWDVVGPSSSLRGTQSGFGGTRWVPALLYVGPTSGSVGPGGSQLVGPASGSVGRGGSQLFSTWDPHRVRWDPVGPSPSLRGTLHPVWVLQC